MFQAEAGVKHTTTMPEPTWYNPTSGNANISAKYGQAPSNPATTWRAYGVHTGVDYGVKTGTPAYAISNGRVVKSGFDKGIGNYVTIEVAPGRQVTYEHLSSVGVKAGDSLKGGQQLGSTGNTGSLSQGSHLHTEYTKNGNLVSPSTFYGKNTPKWVSQAAKAPAVLGKGFNYGSADVNNINNKLTKSLANEEHASPSRNQSFSSGFAPTVISSPVA